MKARALITRASFIVMQAADKFSHPTTRVAELDVKPCDYQPSKADMEDEVDIPGMSIDQIRKAFFRPFRPKQDQYSDAQ